MGVSEVVMVWAAGCLLGVLTVNRSSGAKRMRPLERIDTTRHVVVCLVKTGTETGRHDRRLPTCEVGLCGPKWNESEREGLQIALSVVGFSSSRSRAGRIADCPWAKSDSHLAGVKRTRL